MVDQGIKDMYAYILSMLFMRFYSKAYNYADFRIVGEFNTAGVPQKFLKIETALRIAGLRGRILKAVVQGNDIVIGEFELGYIVRRYYDRVLMTRILDMMGYQKGDVVVVLAKPFEVRIRRADREIYKLAKRRYIDAGEVGFYLDTVKSYLEHKGRKAKLKRKTDAKFVH